MEEWKEITDYPNYEISNLGNVKNKKLNKLLKPFIVSQRYYGIRLFNDNKYKTFNLHRLLATIFIPNPYNFKRIHHIDKNPLNNTLDNLRWVDKPHTSKFRGVSWNTKDKKWRVRIEMNGKDTHIGSFEREEEGALAYNNFVISHNLGEFVELNIIE